MEREVAGRQETTSRIHLVEAWGRGVPLILENAPDAHFSEIGGLFITRFLRPSAGDAGTERQENTRKHQENTEKAPAPAQPIRHRLLALLRQHPESSVRALAQALAISPDSARHHLRRLQDEGQVRRVGPDRGGHWQVLQGGDERDAG